MNLQNQIVKEPNKKSRSGNVDLKASIFFKVQNLFDQLKIKICPVPLEPYSKRPSVGGWASEDYEPSTIPWQLWSKGNVGIIPGRSNLVIFDCDSMETVSFFEYLARRVGLSTDTLIVQTRKGRHYYYYCEFSKDLSRKQFHNDKIKLDVIAGTRFQVVAPFSLLKLNENGEILSPNTKEGYVLFEYTPVNTPPELATLSKEQYEILIQELTKTYKQEEHTKQVPQNSKSFKNERTFQEEKNLTKEEIAKIAELLLNYFVEGKRQNIVLYTAGFLRRELNVSIESIFKLYQHLEPIDDPNDIKDRWQAIERTFKKSSKEISGYNGLVRTLGEEKAEELCEKIRQILNAPQPKKILHKEKCALPTTEEPEKETETEEENFIYIELSPKSKKYARCNYDKLCIELVQKKRDERTEKEYYEVHYTVLDCVIDKIFIIENPLTEEKKYEIHLISNNPAEKYTALKGTLAEIWEEMKTKTSYVLNPSIALTVLNIVFSYYLHQGWFQTKQEELPKGFYFIDGNLIAQGYEEKTFTKEDLKNAAIFLNDYIYSHPNPLLVSSILKAGLLLPFSFAQKQLVNQGLLRKKMKYLYFFGESKSGKTTTAMLLSSIWGTVNRISYAAFNSEARAGKHLSSSTHILIIDEVSKDLEFNPVKEILKFSQEDLMARSILSKNLKIIHYPALSALIMISNNHFPNDPALLERFLIFHFRKKDKLPYDKRQRYEKEDFRILQPLGQFVWQYVKKHGLQDDYIEYATEILKAFYQETETHAEWLDWTFIHDTSETEEEQEYRKEAEFFNAIIRFFNQNIKTQQETDFVKSIYYSLKSLKFGKWIWIDDKDYIYISKDFLLELKKHYRCEIRDLEELSILTGWEKKQKRYQNTKIYVVFTTAMEFFYKLNYIPRLLNSNDFKAWLDKKFEIQSEDEDDIPF